MVVDFKESISDPVALDIGNMTVQKGIVSKTIKLALFTDNRNAVWASRQQLMRESYPFALISVAVNRNLFRLQVGDCFKFSYASYDIGNMIFRVVMIEEQSLASEIITVHAIEDVYSAVNFIEGEIGGRDDPIHLTTGNLYGCGDNEYNQLGIEGFSIGYIDYVQLSTDVCLDTSAGFYHSMVIKADGTLWATGLNSNGQLGLGDITKRYEFTQVGSSTDWAQVVCGAYYTVAIKTNGEVWATGSNSSGQLGLGDTTQRTSFVQVSVTDFESIACGYGHVLLIKTDGTLWGSGDNSLGQLGMGATASVNTFTQIGSDTNNASVACGELHSALIKDTGILHTTGYNPYGELGFTAYDHKNVFTVVNWELWRAVACGSYYTVAIRGSWELYGTGNNNAGQIGLGAIDSVDEFTQIGTVLWKSVECGVDSTYAVQLDDTVWATGSNEYGKLGINSYDIEVTTFQQITESWHLTNGGWFHRLALKDDGTLWGVGYTRDGQLGLGNTMLVDRLTLCNEETWLSVDCWENHTIAIHEDNSLWGVGRNNFGQIGYGLGSGGIVFDFTQISSDSWRQVACGVYHTSCLKTEGTLWSTGSNYYGQLGVGDYLARYELLQMTGEGATNDWIFVAAGGFATMAIRSDATLWCTGKNSGSSAGQLGLNDSVDRNTVIQAIGTDWKQVSLGGCHAAAVRSDGTLWTTGRNNKGQLGLGDNVVRLVWTQVGDSDWAYVECGADFTLAVKTNGALYGAGHNWYGQLGLSDNADRNTFVPISDGWGADDFNGLPLFSGGEFHSLAVLVEDLNSTGRNIEGQLAIGASGSGVDRNEFASILHSLPNRGSADSWEFVVCGRRHTMALNAGNFLGQSSGCNLLPFTHKTIVESPYMFTSDLAVIPIAARASDIQLGINTHMSIDGGSSYLMIGGIANLRPYGTLVGTYPASTYTIDDEVGFTIDFSTSDVDLIDTTIWPNVLAALNNNAMLGNEFITFQTITPISGSQYKIEGIIRGRLDTEKVEHSNGEDFYYIGSQNITNIKHSEIVAGSDRKFKLVPYTMNCVGDLSEADVIDVSISGRGKKPYAPRNFLANGSSFAGRYSANIVLTWSPGYHGRGAGIGIPGEVLPDTDREGLFEIEVYVSDILVRTTTAIDAATWTYTSAMNTTDNGSLADEIVFKLLNYRTEDGYVYESDQVEVMCKES